jgi:hypothetical protein
LEAEELLALSEEKVAFYKRAPGDAERNVERILGLNNAYIEHLEWVDAEKTKRTKELENKYQDVLDLNRKEYAHRGPERSG